MEYVIGPVLSVLITLGLIKKTSVEHKNKIQDALEKIEEVESRVDLMSTQVENIDKEILAKSLKVILPIAQATERLQEAVGVK